MYEKFPRPRWVRDDGFDMLCRRLLEVFPDTAPQVVAGEMWGDYADAQRAFDLHGSHWSCTAIFKNRDVVCFINDDTYLFFLPRMISCCLREEGLDGDIFDYVVFGLEHKLSEFSTLFSAEQRVALIAPLQYLFGGVVLEDCASEANVKTMRRILVALRD